MIIASSFLYLKPHFTIINTVLIIGGIVFAMGFIALYLLKGTYGKDLDFLEEEQAL